MSPLGASPPTLDVDVLGESYRKPNYGFTQMNLLSSHNKKPGQTIPDLRHSTMPSRTQAQSLCSGVLNIVTFHA